GGAGRGDGDGRPVPPDRRPPPPRRPRRRGQVPRLAGGRAVGHASRAVFASPARGACPTLSRGAAKKATFPSPSPIAPRRVGTAHRDRRRWAVPTLRPRVPFPRPDGAAGYFASLSGDSSSVPHRFPIPRPASARKWEKSRLLPRRELERDQGDLGVEPVPPRGGQVLHPCRARFDPFSGHRFDVLLEPD